ncbi:MAG: hypothetical protein EZS28_026075 [Streblomastix strix]|uniref:Uncharacterized protein n=1 Tax=Streblomastix strix TaxID=222440 RepID=A0A5J4V6Y7_9EUKA|nr:MAG: hypothetical protein EZS28_026075 [Streblomastix strix]
MCLRSRQIQVNYPLGQKDRTEQKILSPTTTRDILTYGHMTQLRLIATLLQRQVASWIIYADKLNAMTIPINMADKSAIRQNVCHMLVLVCQRNRQDKTRQKNQRHSKLQNRWTDGQMDR